MPKKMRHHDEARKHCFRRVAKQVFGQNSAAEVDQGNPLGRARFDTGLACALVEPTIRDNPSAGGTVSIRIPLSTWPPTKGVSVRNAESNSLG